MALSAQVGGVGLVCRQRREQRLRLGDRGKSDVGAKPSNASLRMARASFASPVDSRSLASASAATRARTRALRVGDALSVAIGGGGAAGREAGRGEGTLGRLGRGLARTNNLIDAS
jgi:hypothetical protein